VLLYIVLYFQNLDRVSPLTCGWRLAIITGGSLLTAIPAGRLSARVPARWLIGPGLILVGVGLLLMRGLDADSSWTHLIPGFVIAGLGSGLVNPPLASTAVGVVEPRDAGMASGINTTFRQVGIATAVAALGSIFAAKLAGAGGAPSHATLAAHYAAALNELCLVTGLLALVCAAGSIVLIRTKDFYVQAPASGAEAPAAAAG
jgi:predicted MFS family arabinose efflux permease